MNHGSAPRRRRQHTGSMVGALAMVVALVAALVSGLVGAPSAALAASGAVTFADTALKTCVTDELGVDPASAVTEEQLRSLTRLQCVAKGVRDITPLQYAVNLVALDLASNRITTVAPLASDTALVTLLLQHNVLTTIIPLRYLTGLRSLNLSNNQVVDLQWIAESGLTTFSAANQALVLPPTGIGSRVGLPKTVSTTGIRIPVTLAPGSIDGTLTTDTVSWSEVGTGRLRWSAAVPYGSHGATALFTGSATQVVQLYPVSNVSRPFLEGSAIVGSTLIAHHNVWNPGNVTFSYQWLRAGKPIAGATGVRYTTTSADVGHAVSAAVTGSLPPAFSPTTVATAGLTVRAAP